MTFAILKAPLEVRVHLHRHGLGDQAAHICCQGFWGDESPDRTTTWHKGKRVYTIYIRRRNRFET